MSGLIARQLLKDVKGPARLEMFAYVAHHRDAAVGAAQVATALEELEYPFQVVKHGRLELARPGRQATATFGMRLGDRRVLEWPQLEVLAFERLGNVTSASTWAALDGQVPASGTLLRLLEPLVKFGWLRRAIAHSARRRRRPPRSDQDKALQGWAALRVDVRCDELTRSKLAVVRDIDRATAWLPCYLVSQLLDPLTRPSPGLYCPCDIVNQDHFWPRVVESTDIESFES